MIATSTYVELALRNSHTCAGCGESKGDGIVCWGCWTKSGDGLKRWNGTLGDWLLMTETEQRRAL